MSDANGLSAAEAARDAPEAVALVDGGVPTRWADLASEVERDAARLFTGDFESPVAHVGSLDRGTIARFFACIERGRAFAPIHPKLPDGERAARATRLAAIDVSRLGLAKDHADPEHPAALLFTSGSSGPAKLAVLSRRAFVASARASAAGGTPFGPGDRWFLAMPLAHVGGLAILARAVLARAAVVVDGPFDPLRSWDTLERDAVTHVSLVPTMLQRLLDAANGRRAPKNLRTALLGGAAAPAPLLERARAAGWPVRVTYGLTEACSQVATERTGGPIGRAKPLPGVAVSIDAGEIVVSGPTLFSGYVSPAGTLDDPPGPTGFRTGDLGHLDPDGHLHVTGRASDVIVTGGENVHPAEVEAVLLSMPGVTSATVVGLPDPTWGELLAAAVTGDADPFTLATACEPLLAPHQRPRRWLRLDTLPTHPNGKVDRHAIVAAFGDSTSR